MAETATRGALLGVLGVIFGSQCIGILGTWLTAESEALRQERKRLRPSITLGRKGDKALRFRQFRSFLLVWRSLVTEA